jgi:hypothetical protein
MNINKWSFTAGNIFGATVVGLVVVACGGGGGSGAIVQNDFGTISASNIILNNSEAGAFADDGFIRVQANQLPSNVKVLASNVSLARNENSLKSEDLQTALDKEIAVDLVKSIVGVWTVENITSDATYAGALSTGRVEFFDDGTYVISEGGFGAAGKVASGTGSFCAIPNTQTYRLIDGAVYFEADAGGDSVAIVAKSTADSITLIGDGGCGAQGISRIAILTRVDMENTQPVRANNTPTFSQRMLVASSK